MNLSEQKIKALKFLVIVTGIFALLQLMPGRANAQVSSASFTSNVITGCAPLSVDFINLSTQASNYVWDFGNGNTSTLTDPTTVYITPGQYTVTLIAINSLTGDRDTLIATNYINVVADPVVDFVASPLIGCAGNNSITFTNLSSNATSYIWDFGDGNFSTQTDPVHSYSAVGTYTVKLIARNNFNCSKIEIKPAYISIVPNAPAAFTVNQQSSCNTGTNFNFNATTPGAVSWFWDFGNGVTSTVQNPSYVYGAMGSYDVTLIVTNANGCKDTLVKPGYINIGPNLVPSFTVTNQAGCFPLSTTFTCTVPGAISWNWDFGDGTTSTLQSVPHTYLTPGNYDITLAVTTTSGCNGSVTLPDYITVDDYPTASFTLGSATGCKPYPALFTNTSVGASTYLWTFGDGNTSTAFNPVNTYNSAGTFNVNLIATSPNGCTDTTTVNSAVTVNTVTASFSAAPRVGCSPLTVAFGSTAVNTATWEWDFGDGTTGTGSSVSHTYVPVNNYNIQLIVTSIHGCKDTLVKPAYVRVSSGTVPYTVPDTIIVCTPPGAVSFTDPTVGSNSWIWHFGDGDSSTIKNPSHNYDTPGIYTVTLTTAMPGGCGQTFNPYAIIKVLPFIVSPITSVIVSPCGPYTVQFNNGTVDVASYLWDFGDGNTSTLANPSHTYAQPGTYNISLQLTSINGCLVTLSATVTVGHVSPLTVSDMDACQGDSISFVVTPSSAFVSASWNFGDGNSSSVLNPVHVFNTAGSFTVTGTLTDTMGCVNNYTIGPILISNPVPSFTVNQATTGCAPFVVQFTNTSTGSTGYWWNFGNSNTSTSASPNTTYTAAGTYSVSLTVSANGCVRNIVQTNLITVNVASANFSFTPSSGCVPATVNFTDLSVNPVSWSWNFGDGNTSSVQNPVHIYTTAPTGVVSLTITDINGCTKTRNRTPIEIIVPQISVNDSTGCRPFNVNFTSTTAATSYLWDFGDGATSSQQNPSHTYTVAGLYTVTLTCVLASGCTTTTVKPGFIEVIAPVTNFMSPTQAVCAPSLVNFVNQSTGAVSWHWDFGDGTSSTNQNPSHIYNVPGTYTVTLISFSSEGCSDTLVKPDYILVPGTLSDFSITSQSTCLQTIAQFVDQSLNASSWFWNFGDGFTSTLQNPTHTYLTTGSFTVTLITTDSVGCSSFYAGPNPVVVHPDPVASGTITIKNGCNPLTTSFVNSSTGAVSYVWHFGNGDTSTDVNPVYTYTTPGFYQPYMVAYTSFGCTDTVFMTSGVTVYSTPVANFTRSVNNACAPVSVTFTNQSAPLDNPVFAWNFGNGDTSSAMVPTYTFNTPGTFQVQLIVTNTGGCTDTVTKSVTVRPSPVANAVASIVTGCSPLPVSFTDSSVDAVSYIWDFGDGSTSTSQNPSHTYTSGGIYNVTLIVTSSTGCTDTLVLPTPINVYQTPNANFTRNPTSGCEPLPVVFNSTSSLLNNPVYSWNFGDGNTSSLAAPSNTFNTPGIFNVSLVVTNDGGCTDTVIKTVTVHPKPDAVASASVMTGCSPLAVSFTNNSVDATTYSWDFGDGTTSTSPNPSHTYTAAGSYFVMLIASNANGCIDTLLFSNPIVVNQTPNANFSRTPVSGCTPVLVTFTNTSNQLNNPVYSWNFGNGQTSSLASPTFNYTTAGNYQVMLVVTNDAGCTDTVTKSVTINETPVAAASLGTTQGCSPVTVSFTNNSIGATTYTWNFGDGGTSALSDPTYTYSTPGVYTVSMIATTGAGCADTVILPIPVSVYEIPVANFTRTPSSGCAPINVSFTNTSTSLAGATYLWDFGNGQTSNLQNPTMFFGTSGVYQVQLVVTNVGGCADTVVKNVAAHPVAIAAGSASDTVGCSPFTVNFTNSSVDATSYTWDFGDGSSSTGVNPSHTYTAAGIYTVTLIATNSNNCADTLVFPNSIHVNQSPIANFSRTPSSGCSPLTVIFNNASQQQQSPTYLWDFGNGQTGIGTTDTILYVNAGTYQPTLIITNSNGCTDTITKSLTVHQTPDAIATVSGTNGCAPYAVTFTNNSLNATSYSWNFGDGSTSTNANPSHTYTVAGSYQVMLIASNSNGCIDTLLFSNPIVVNQTPNANFSRTPVSGCTPVLVTFTNTSNQLNNPVYAWNFGNGQTSSLSSPTFNYTTAGNYQVMLVVTNDAGCSDTVIKPVTIHETPTAAASLGATQGCSPVTVNFTNNSVGASSYSWNFGDGGTSTLTDPVYTYTTPGVYTVSMIATSGAGCSDTVTLPLPVSVYQVPVANFSRTPSSGCAPVSVLFNNTSSSLVSATYAWDFGNGQSSASQNPSITFTNPGTYPVQLIVTNTGGCSDTIVKNVTVHSGAIASATVNDTVGCTPFNAVFTNSSTGATSYSWDFGDGSSSTGVNPSHTYTAAGIYTVTLIATNSNNCADTLVFPNSIHVNQSPIANFSRTPSSGCSPLTVIFNNASQQQQSPTYLWDFGNGQTTTGAGDTVLYVNAGVYQPTLIVTNSNGCSDTLSKPVTVHQTPDAIATVSGTNGCAPYAVTFTNNSLNATSYSWNFGDGSTSTNANPSHTYTVAGDYTVTLIATGAGGCKDTLIIAPQIHVKATPSAAFTSNVTAGCMPLTVNFNDISTGLVGAQYAWVFGNGQSSSQQNPVATFTAAGTYTVQLVVTNDEGCSDTASATIVVDPLPVAQATVANATGCSPLVTSFTNISTGAGSYTWFFGDNTTSAAASPSHTYTAGGIYTVTLVAMNQFGCSDTFVFPNQVIVNQTPVASFTHTGLSGCTPLNINFTSTSTLLNSPVYSWDFGNGQTASTANASASYITGGTYPVSFIVTNSAGCADTATTTVTAFDQPVAIASTIDTVGCAPHTATFVNNSLHGTGYLWNFGDGTTSTLQAPSHTYTIAGNYIVSLIVTGAGGCADTIVFNYPIHIKAQPVASFGPVSVTGCTPLTINFTNLSTGLVGPSFNWDFGTGAGSTIKDPSYTYTIGGTFGVVLTVTNSEGCSDTATASVTANLTPVAQAASIDPDGCAPHAITFNSTSLLADTITWNFGDGTTSGLSQIVHNYPVAGTYFPYLIASTTAGCADTFFFATPVQVNPVPTAAFTVNQTASCSGTTFQFMSQSTPTTGLTYNWNIAGTPYTTQNPAVPILAPGFYNASLIVTNQFGCSDTMDQPNYIQVYDTLPPGATPILSVSVVNNTSVEITWQNSSALDLGAYILYRLNNVTGVYDQIYRDNTPNNSSMSVTSTYVDQGLATLQNVYTYKLQTVDQCEYALPLSASIPHTTMNVTAVPQNDDIRVTWTKYFGCTVSSYEVNRLNLADGTSQLVATVPPNTTSYLDQGFYCPDEYSYRITATSLCGNAYLSLSDTSVAVPANPLADQKVEVVRSTVINDKDVLTEWLPPVLAPNRVLQYNVLRSADNISFVEIANLPASALSYIDYDTDVHQQEYYYRIDVVSDCEVAGALSNNSSSILLKSDWQNEKTKLWWTKYTNWDTGVDYYIIEQENSFGQWDPVKTVDGNETQTTLDE